MPHKSIPILQKKTKQNKKHMKLCSEWELFEFIFIVKQTPPSPNKKVYFLILGEEDRSESVEWIKYIILK